MLSPCVVTARDRALSLLVTKACHGTLGFGRVGGVGTGVPWVSMPGPTSVPSDSQAGWHREQSANTVREVGASTVVSSAFANVFVTLSSVMVFRICETVMLVFCDMLEYLHSPHVSWIWTGSLPLSRKSTSLFKMVTCLSSLAFHTNFARLFRSSHVPMDSAIRQANCFHLRTPDHPHVTTRGCLPHDGSTSMVMTFQCRILDQLQHC